MKIFPITGSVSPKMRAMILTDINAGKLGGWEAVTPDGLNVRPLSFNQLNQLNQFIQLNSSKKRSEANLTGAIQPVSIEHSAYPP